MKEQEMPLGLMMKKIGESMVQRMNNAMQHRDLTTMQSHVLMNLHRSPEQTLTLKELESRFGVAQSTMAGLVSRLEKKGLVAPTT